MLILFVLCLVVIDVFILGSYTAIEGCKGQLGVRKISNKENLEETMGVNIKYCTLLKLLLRMSSLYMYELIHNIIL